MTRIALVGSPNSGKSTLFNALTGSRQKTGNYPGVTVEKKEGVVELGKGLSIALLDLPGAYSLEPKTPDETITTDIIQGRFEHEDHPKVIIAVADSTNLERNLYLVLQLKELGLPMVLALTMSDLAKKRGIEISTKTLEQILGVPVVITSAIKKHGINDLIKRVQDLLSANPGQNKTSVAIDNTAAAILKRYQKIEDTLKATVKKTDRIKDRTRKIDSVLMHKFFGPLILVLAFALVFQSIFTFAEVPKDYLEKGLALLQNGARAIIPAGWFQSLITEGIIAGVGAVLVFLPQILILFAFILFFEDSGYMARAAFILDRLMSKVGLSGRAFIPLLSSFACAIPGIMATRTIDRKKDRLITIMISPLMTCSARLPVYALIITAFIPDTRVFGFFTTRGLVMTGLYLFGIFFALLVAAILSKTLLKGDKSFFILELPTYKMPSLKNILLGLYERSKIFLYRAGTIILSVAIVLWVLSNFPVAKAPEGLTEKVAASYQIENSYAGKIGKAIEPVLKPLGYDWKIGIGILSSFAAREVIVSTLSTVYAVQIGDDNTEELAQKIKSESGATLATALSLLVFYALACQCISTLAITRRETNSLRWPAFMFVYMSLLAYSAAFFTYQITALLIQ